MDLLGVSGSLAIGTEISDNIISDRVVVRRIGAVRTVRLVFAIVDFLYPFPPYGCTCGTSYPELP